VADDTMRVRSLEAEVVSDPVGVARRAAMNMRLCVDLFERQLKAASASNMPSKQTQDLAIACESLRRDAARLEQLASILDARTPTVD
jgi:hypothetical protein